MTKPLHARLFLGILTLLTFALIGCNQSDSSSNRDTASETSMLDSIPSLQEQLDSRRDNFTESAPADMVTDFNRGVEDLRTSGVLETALRAGDTAADFTLPNHMGQPVTLSQVAADGPVVLVWYRGGWCPYCNMQLAAYSEVMPIIDSLGASVIAISPELPDKASETVAGNKLPFTVVSDTGNHVAKDYGIAYQLPDYLLSHFEGRLDFSEYNGDNKNELPLAVTYVVDSDRVIRYDFVDADYKRRAEPSEVISVLINLQKK